MLEKLKLLNFQGHIDSTLEFSKGVNVIIGESDEGKSSIIRAIEYLGLNSPSKNNYKNRKCKDKDLMQIAGTFNGTLVTRLKSKTINQYQINDEKPFKALKTELPDEVQQIMNLKDINIQSQSDAYFMLNLTPGQVAKKINKVVNLEVMHKVLSGTKTDITDAKQNVLFWTTKKDEYIKEVKDLAWVVEARKQGGALQKTALTINKELERYNAGDKLAQSYKDLCIEIEKFKNLDSAIKALKKLEKQQVLLDEKIHKYNTLVTLADNAVKIKTQINAYKGIQKAQKQLNALISLTEEIETANQIHTLLVNCITIQTERKNATKDAAIEQKVFTEALKANGVCPFCEQKIK